MNLIDQIKNTLIVSCQAVDDEPLNDSYVLSKMCYALVLGGAKVLRLSQVEHIKKIKEVVNVPIIGLIKKHYDNSEVFITPTIKEVDQLVDLKVDIIALDATLRKRPDQDLTNLIKTIKTKYPNQLLMADCSNISDAINAQNLGFDLISTTLRGYTKDTLNHNNIENDYQFLKDLKKVITKPIIAEGGIWTPQQAKEILNLGIHSVVVGSAITRLHLIVKYWNDNLK
ncbi:N-acetylmannosamine-6-phosphate 2-epimerase [Mycoplasma mycoides subsp. capri]|uniref:N-acetylmannosamine-6-phosphate 2-epimerase n=1 Tax=Mycoplasma mycoides TaxID=2102 RepID=UPI002240CC13|nr:N-acetylmannosamine-6-phosphate 2-epimerase [Mycoplasma mycoides]UZK63798.1 N-acetylmannosamine-6-phosphate 2-epimerase [Mycoplasma mycoides subsp. capri]